ncbi:MAG TPA: hypothetical protein VG370_34810 [Chloroflexota bacterium]|nr:hypothetical protein [Chloroflexota bacterium]
MAGYAQAQRDLADVAEGWLELHERIGALEAELRLARFEADSARERLRLAHHEIARLAAASAVAVRVCGCADAYTDCLAEFAATAAGDLSARACGEHLDALTAAVLAWNEASGA